MVTAIIFDLYGVLALNGWQGFKAHHFADREDVWDEVFLLGRRVDAGLADYDELIRFTAQQTGESHATVRYQLEHTVANQELFGYIRSQLKPHYKLGILSNASSSKVIDQLFTTEEEQLFDVITLSHHVGLTKPDTKIYEAIADKLGEPIGKCLFIDDQERHASGAREAGMQAVLYSDTAHLRKQLQAALA